MSRKRGRTKRSPKSAARMVADTPRIRRQLETLALSARLARPVPGSARGASRLASFSLRTNNRARLPRGSENERLRQKMS